MTMAWGWLGVVLFSARTAPAAPTFPSSWGENVWAQWGALFSAQALVAVVLSPLFATAMPPAELRSGWREGFPHTVLWRAASAAVWHQLIPAIVDHGSAGEAPPVIPNGSRVIYACVRACVRACIHAYLRWVTNGTRPGFGHQGFDAWLELLLAATTAYGCISGARVLLSTGAALLLAREEDPAFFLRSLSRDSGAGRGWGGCIRFGWAAVEIACLAGVLLGEYSMFWLYLGRLLVLPQGAGGGRVERSPVSTRMYSMHACIVYVFVCLHAYMCACTHTHTRAHAHTHTHRSSSCCCRQRSLCTQW